MHSVAFCFSMQKPPWLDPKSDFHSFPLLARSRGSQETRKQCGKKHHHYNETPDCLLSPALFIMPANHLILAGCFQFAYKKSEGKWQTFEKQKNSKYHKIVFTLGQGVKKSICSAGEMKNPQAAKNTRFEWSDEETVTFLKILYEININVIFPLCFLHCFHHFRFGWGSFS